MASPSAEARIEALLEEIERHPDDTGAYLVLADALVEAGDPRGELIHVQHALAAEPASGPARPRGRIHDRHGALREPPVEKRDVLAEVQRRARLVARERALVAQRRARLLGALDVDVIELEYRRGFLDLVAVHDRSWADDPYSMGRALATIFASPEARLLRVVEIHPRPSVSPYPDEVAAVLAELAAAARTAPPSVRRLVLGCSYATAPGYRHGRAPDDLRGLFPLFASIEELHVDLGAVDLRWAPRASERLRRFTWISPSIHRDALAPLASWHLPALTAFTLWTGATYRFDHEAALFGPDDPTELGAPAERLEVADLEPVFHLLDRCPALRELGLANHAGPIGELLAALAKHPCAARIERLDLSCADLHARDVRTLATGLRALPALRALHLEGVPLDDEHRAALSTDARVVTGAAPPQGEPPQRHRRLVPIDA